MASNLNHAFIAVADIQIVVSQVTAGILNWIEQIKGMGVIFLAAGLGAFAIKALIK